MNHKKQYITLILLVLSTMATAQVHSVLSSGRWWKLGVAEDGLYRVTTSNIPSLAGASTDSLAVYGMGGGMLTTENSLLPTGDPVQLAIEVNDLNGNGRFDSGDELFFYGQGAERWTYNTTEGRWVFNHHAYALENYYYLTASCATPKRIAVATAPVADTTVTTYTVVAHVDNDMVNIFETGQVWVGEKLSTSVPRRTFDLRLPGSNLEEVALRYALASKDASKATFTMSTNGFSQQTLLSESNAYRTVVAGLNAAQSYTFTLTYVPVENSGSGYLDFIELNAQSQLDFSNGQLAVRDALHGGKKVRYLTSTPHSMRVWEVGTTGGEREMAVSNGSWTDSVASVGQYIVFDGYTWLSPTSVEALEPQDLHGSTQADLVIVSHPLYLEQAQRLAGLHEVMDGLSTLTVTDRQVYNEFSSGKQDPMAIRAFLRWLKASYPSHPPRYLILFGKGTYDNRDLLGKGMTTVVTYESYKSFTDDYNSFASDDMLGFLDDNGHGDASETLEVSVGRLPAKSVEEATHIVDKIEGYMMRRDLMDETIRGDWRNYVALLADDADPGKTHIADTIFTHSSEAIATRIKKTLPQFNIDRLYADAYHQESGAIGSYYPDLNNALRQRMNYGCLLLNYIGHGSTGYIGTERYIELSDIDAYSNTDRLPLLVTSTCSYGHYDLIDELCGAEACLLAPAAMVSVISAARPITHIESFNKDVVLFALDPANTIGDALRKAKNRSSLLQDMCIGILGDPALRLSQPENRVKVTYINSEPVDDTTDVRAEVLTRVTVQGEIQDAEGQLLDDFEGTLYPVVYDREMRTATLANDNPGTEVTFWQQKNILYKGSHPVSGGQFEYSFLVPKDVSYRYDYAKLSHYAKSGSDQATGSFTHLMLGGMSDSAYADATAPEIRLFMGDSNFRPGAITGPSPTLLANLFDSAGINIGTGLGHDITAMLDDNPNSLIVLNDLYQQNIADSRRGSVAYTLQDLAPGRHTVTVKAWNIFGLSATASVTFRVHGNDTLIFSKLDCSPNPATTQATFALRVNTPAAITTAEFQVYNSRGQMILTVTPDISADGFIIGPVVWNVAQVPPGLYIARMVVTDSDGETHQECTKCIVR